MVCAVCQEPDEVPVEVPPLPVLPLLLPLVEPDADVPVLPSLEDVCPDFCA